MSTGDSHPPRARGSLADPTYGFGMLEGPDRPFTLTKVSCGLALGELAINIDGPDVQVTLAEVLVGDAFKYEDLPGKRWSATRSSGAHGDFFRFMSGFLIRGERLRLEAVEVWIDAYEVASALLHFRLELAVRIDDVVRTFKGTAAALCFAP